MTYITGSASPPQSLGLELKATVCRNQIQRTVGNYSALYFADQSNIQDVYIELDELQVWSSNPQETYQQLVVSCSGPLEFTGVRPNGSSVTLTANKMLVLDTEFRTFKLSNINTERVRAQLNFVSTRP
jgi:hypothetical protein